MGPKMIFPDKRTDVQTAGVKGVRYTVKAEHIIDSFHILTLLYINIGSRNSGNVDSNLIIMLYN